MNIHFDLFPGGKTKALTMSYDDGQVFDRKLVHIFNKYGIKGTFHLNSGILDEENFITKDEVANLYKNHEVSLHAKNHPFLDCIPVEGLIEEMVEDRKTLESLVGYPIKGMSYPYGAYNKNIIKILKSLGIQYSRTVNSHHDFYVPENFLEWNATCHHDDDLINLGEKFLNYNFDGKLKLMYVWGHSFEFERNNNWDLIEEFCKLMCQSNDIWFATNIEVMRYIKALKMLEFSAKGDMVYNPTAIELWIRVNNKKIKVKSGETTIL